MDKNLARVLATLAIWMSPLVYLGAMVLTNQKIALPLPLFLTYVMAMFGATMSIWIPRD